MCTAPAAIPLTPPTKTSAQFNPVQLQVGPAPTLARGNHSSENEGQHLMPRYAQLGAVQGPIPGQEHAQQQQRGTQQLLPPHCVDPTAGCPCTLSHHPLLTRLGVRAVVDGGQDASPPSPPRHLSQSRTSTSAPSHCRSQRLRPSRVTEPTSTGPDDTTITRDG